NTSLYGDSLVRITAHYFLAVFHYIQWKFSPTSESQEAAFYHLASWDEEWVSHQKDIASLPGCATPLQDDGMVDLCNTIHAELSR
ncbi:MAG: hypothetical protein KJ645_04470, partial [Planctomycetes bacterium]|nr:hypothetical protein [Planctomycetota bacterium]